MFVTVSVCTFRRFQPNNDSPTQPANTSSPAAAPSSNTNPPPGPPGPPGPYGPNGPPPHPGKHEGRPSQTWMPPLQGNSKDKVGLPAPNGLY